jgi:hypothetical protein
MMNIIRVAITVILPMGISLAQETAAPKPASTGAASGDSASLVKTNSQKYKGTLVDAVCAHNGASTSPSSQSSADRASQRDASQKEGTSRQSNAAESCAATAGTTDFALRLSDGRTLKTKKKWVDAAATRKPIRSTVHGVETGDTLMALSID